MRFDPNSIRRLNQTVRQSERNRFSRVGNVTPPRTSTRARVVFVMITGNTSAETDRWYYSGSQVIPSGAGGGTWETVVDGLSFSTEGDPYLINLREIHPTGAWGNQVDPTGDAPPNGGSLTLRPIENGTVVEVKSVYASSGAVVWVFDVPNGVTAVCGEPEE